MKASSNIRCDYGGHIIPKGKHARVVTTGDCQGTFCSQQHWNWARNQMQELKKHGNDDTD